MNVPENLENSLDGHVTNPAVLERIGKQKVVLITIKTCKLEYLGHMRNPQRYELLQLILQGKTEGKPDQEGEYGG